MLLLNSLITRNLCLIIVITCVSFSANALEFTVGIGCSNSSILVEDKQLSDSESRAEDDVVELAKILGRGVCLPVFGLRTKADYFSFISSGRWGYFSEFNATRFNLKEQDIPGSRAADLGTRIKGYSVYAVPVLFYRFGDFSDKTWTFKVGLGAGVGYLNIKGNIQITEVSSARYGEVEKVNISGLAGSYGIYLDALKGNHLIVFQQYGPKLNDNEYNYFYGHSSLSYSYKFNLF